jgi:hypothetical protein
MSDFRLVNFLCLTLLLQWLKSLNLSKIRDASKIKLILELAKVRCQGLTKVTLKDRSEHKDFSKVFGNHVEVLTALSDLDLSHTHFTDQDASLLGMNAPNVKKLILQGRLGKYSSYFYPRARRALRVYFLLCCCSSSCCSCCCCC